MWNVPKCTVATTVTALCKYGGTVFRCHSNQSRRFFFLITSVNSLFWVLFLFQNLRCCSCCCILWYWQKATYMHTKYGHLDYLLPQPSKLPYLCTDDVPLATDIAFLPAHLFARHGMIHESRDAIKYWPIGRNQKPFYDKHVFLLSSALEFSVILWSKR
jgi:hypothetical protein